MILIIFSFFTFSFADVIDVPKAHTVEYGYILLKFRFYNYGLGLHLNGGVLSRVSLGGSIDIGNLIGTESISIRRPSPNIKWRFFDGIKYLPMALALGYDGQGYKYSEEKKMFTEPAKELYLTALVEVVDGLDLTFGSNFNAEQKALFLFFGFNYTIAKILSILLEIDDIYSIREYQLNSGIKIHFSENVGVDVFFKDINSKPERYIQINWLKKI